MIYPKEFPIDNDNIYEKEVFECLYNQFSQSSDYDVFFSKKFSGSVKSEKVDYELDFLISDLRNDKFNSLLVVEVKGNQLKFNGAENKWIQDGRVMSTAPNTQARQNMGSLLQRFPEVGKNTPVGWAVWFPKMTNPGKSQLPTELSEEQFFDDIAIRYPVEKIEACFKHIKSQWSSKQGDRLHVYHNFKESLIRGLGYTLPLHKRIASSNAKFLELTKKQLELLRLIGANNDVLVKGPAGSGKTIMATTIAKEIAEKDKKVLLLTFNRALANNIRYNLGEIEGVEVKTYHSLARGLITEKFEKWWSENSKNEDFWTLDIPIKLLDLGSEDLPKFDAIVVDEAQDLREEWFETLNNLIKPEGGFYLFMDEDQDIFNALTKIDIDRNFFEFPLEENCRNTTEIIETLKGYVNKKIKFPTFSVEGDPVRKIEYSNDTDQMNKIKALWLDLIEKEGISPDQIVIMMNANKRESCLASIKAFGKYKIQAVDRSGRLDKRVVNYTSINTFKGLEADVVFIIDTDKPIKPDYKVLYTQASRAKVLLCVFEKSKE